MIHVENLTKFYAGIPALSDISFRVEEHEVLGFLGPNGAGKSTTLRILAGFLSASKGRVTVAGIDVFAKPKEVKQLIGYLPENVPLYPEMRVCEFLNYRASLKRVPGGKKKTAVDSAIERCQIGDVRDRIVGQLSKGYRQRVGLADALVGDPKILILDEPTIGLDPNQIRQVRDLIRELGQERTVILSSHILPEVEAVCSRVQIIHKGKLAGQGKPDELRAGLDGGNITLTLEVMDRAGCAPSTLGAIEGVESINEARDPEDGVRFFCLKVTEDIAVREHIFDAAVASDFKLVGMKTEKRSLEDVFLDIITRESAPTDEPDEEEKGEEK